MASRATAVAATALVAVLALALPGCTTTNAVARVNGTAIEKAELDRQFEQMKKSSPALFQGTEGKARETEYRAKILQSLITVELVGQAASKLGVKVSDAEVDEYIKGLEKQYGGASGLQDAMKAAGVSSDQLKESVQRKLLYEAVRTKVTKVKKVTDAEARAYYEKNPATFASTAQVRVAHVLLAEKDKARAEQIFGQVKGGADIAALAKSDSIDPGSKDKGGDLGWASPTTYVAEFATAVSEMKVGEARLVKSQFGWHVIKMLETKDATVKPFSEVKDQITSYLAQEDAADQFTAYVEDLRSKAKVEILDAELKKAMEGTATVSPTP